MTWADFLRYSKYIAVFYGLAVVLMVLGIWMPTGINYRFIWSAVLCFGVALASNVALGFYHANHKAEMRFAKAVYIQQEDQDAPVDITSNSKDLAIVTDDEGKVVLSPQLADLVDDVAYQAARKARGY
jgi:hypothetical protein